MLNTGLTACKLLAPSLSDVQEVEQRRDRNEYLKKDKTKQNKIKTIGLISKTTTLHVHHTFLYNSLPFLHDYDVKMPNYAFCRERKQATTKFYFSF